MFLKTLAAAAFASILLFGADHPPAVQGKIVDPSQTGLTGTIRFKSLDAGTVEISIDTDASGSFLIDTLPSGRYELTAISSGFYDVTFSPVVYAFPRTVDLNVTMTLNLTTLDWENYAAGTTVRIGGELRSPSGALEGLKLCVSGRSGKISCDITDKLGQYYLETDDSEGIHVVRLSDQVERILAEGEVDLTNCGGATLPLVSNEGGTWSIVPPN